MLQSSSRRSLSLAAALALAVAAPAPAATYADVFGDLHLVMMTGGDSSSINGDSDDWNRARSLRRNGEGLLYFRKDGSAYVVRDATMLARADAIMEPQRELGRRQGALGRQQAALGRQQAALGRRQTWIGARQWRANADANASMSRSMGDLGASQAQLGRQQAELGRQQGELGRQQAALGKIANAKLRDLIDEAMRRGLAQRVG
jgi:hypothetical protein